MGIFYHRTTPEAAAAILAAGFRDEETQALLRAARVLMRGARRIVQAS